MPISATDLNKAYLAYFGRPSDATGRAYFSTLEQADVIAAFDASAESQALYGNDVTAKVNAIYQNLFNREAEPAGLQYWVGMIVNGHITPTAVAFEILNNALGTDAVSVANKLTASEAFVAAMDTTPEILGYSGLGAAASARNWLRTVDDEAASLSTALAGVDEAVANATGTEGGGGNEAGSQYVLTTNQDVLTGTAKNDFFRAVAGQPAGAQDQTTLNSSDILDGGDGQDTLIVNLNGDYGGGARVRSVETLQLGSNVVGGVTFDYNVNQGQNEITEVKTVVYDQINETEYLTVRNVLKTGGVLPTLAWRNEADSVAGMAEWLYRASAVEGADTTQMVELTNVNARDDNQSSGHLSLGAGVETVHIVSLGSGTNTLNDGGGAGATDLASGAGDLKTVLVSGTQAFGRKAGVLDSGAQQGLTNRAIGSDGGIAPQASASNLISLQTSVTKVDASANTGGVNLRFTSVPSTDVTFIGSAAADYVEFLLGNVNAQGGAGNDTFAFLNNVYLNSTFGSSDTLVGGAGTDTVQLGVNGAGAFTLGTTEFNNKTGIDVLDVRGATSNITLQDAFVGASDAGKLTVRYDRIAQTSDTNPANPLGATNGAALALEHDAVNVLNLTALGPNRSVDVRGGSGSERLVLNDVSFNQHLTMDLGENWDAGGNAAIGADVDTITVVGSAVIDRGDLAGIKGVEGMALVKQVGAAQFTLELTEAFLRDNTLAANNPMTATADQSFVITTGVFAGGVALGAGDTVRIDISDLATLSAANELVWKNSLLGRELDLTDIVAAGVTVEWTYNGVVIPAAAAAGAPDVADLPSILLAGGGAAAVGMDAAFPV